MQDFTVFRALGLSFKSWFRNFIPFTLLTAILYAPVVIYLVTLKPADSWTLDQTLNRIFMYPLYMTVIASTLLPPMLVYKVVQDLNGQKVSFLTSMKYGVRGILPAIIMGGIGVALGQIPAGGIINAVLTCIWFVASPAAVAEKLSNPFTAMSRSGTLTQGRRWGIFGLLFLVGLVQIGCIFVFVAPLFSSHSDPDEATFVGMAIKVVVTMGIFYMFSGIVQAVSYVLLRQDKEGVSHDELAKIFE